MIATSILGAVLPAQSPAISHSPSRPHVFKTVRFDSDLPTGSGISYNAVRWDLDDDGQFDDGQFFAMNWTFQRAGDHDVHVFYDYRVTTCNGDICQTRSISGTDHATVTLHSDAPQVSVSASPANAEVGQVVQMAVSAQQPPGDDSGFIWSTTVPGRTSPYTVPAFGHAFSEPGAHLVRATARTLYSDVGASDAVVVVGPDTKLQPVETPAVSSRPTAHFRFGSSVSGVGFECRLDPVGQAAWERPCGRTTIDGLADGRHRFELVARAPGGEVDPSPVAYEWTVDTQAPDTTIDGPADGFVDSGADVSFEFAGSEPNVRYECSLDQAPFAPCPGDGRSTRLIGLADGIHTLRVRAIDEAGNTDSSPAVRSWRTARPPVLLDADGDGDPLTHDCDDADTRRYHGNREIPRDGVDGNCDGKDGAFPNLSSSIRIQYESVGSRLRVSSLRIERPAAGIRVAIICKGRSCPWKRVGRRIKKSSMRPLELRRTMKGKALHRGTVLEVRLTKPEFLGRIRRDRITRLGPRTQTLCLAPRRVGKPVGSVDRSIKPRQERDGEECS